jgi:hypothetical protein
VPQGAVRRTRALKRVVRALIHLRLSSPFRQIRISSRAVRVNLHGCIAMLQICGKPLHGAVLSPLYALFFDVMCIAAVRIRACHENREIALSAMTSSTYAYGMEVAIKDGERCT